MSQPLRVLKAKPSGSMTDWQLDYLFNCSSRSAIMKLKLVYIYKSIWKWHKTNPLTAKCKKLKFTNFTTWLLIKHFTIAHLYISKDLNFASILIEFLNKMKWKNILWTDFKTEEDSHFVLHFFRRVQCKDGKPKC